MLKSKETLSPEEQRIYFALSERTDRIFTIEMVRALEIVAGGTLRFLLSDMTKKGWLTRLKKGVYYINEPSGRSFEDLFKIATYMFNGYLAFASALRIYGAITETPYTVYIATRNTSSRKNIGNMEIRAVALRKRAVGVTKHDGYTVSSRAKTLYDCFYLPEYAGGYSKIIEAIHSMQLKPKEWKEFLSYVNTFDKSSSKRKIGYLLSMANEVGSRVPANVIRQLNEKGALAKLGSSGRGKYVREWNVMDYLGEGYLLGWSK